MAIIGLLVAVSGPAVYGEIVFEDDFMGDNVVDGDIPVNWQWEMAADLIWIEDRDDVPEHGPGVLILGGDSGGTTHIGLLREETYGLGDYRVTMLFVDRLIQGSDNDGDIHVGIRCMNYDPDLEEVPLYCYEVEFDGDDNDAANNVPEAGPTSFHLFARLPSGTVVLDTTTREEVPRPVSDVWYWMTIEAVGNVTVRAKVWQYGEAEPDWQLEGEHIPVESDEPPEDPEAPVEEKLSIGGVRIGTWSGLANIAYVKVETIEPAAASDWALY